MDISLECLMLFFSVMKSSEVNFLIQRKKDYIKTIEKSLSMLKSVKMELDKKLFKLKISNTIGNIASIAGTGLMFTPPLNFVGLAAVGLGTVTSISSSAYQNYFLQDDKNKLLIDALESEEDAERRHNDHMIHILSTSSKTALFLKKSLDLRRMYDVSSGYRVAYNGVNGVANAMKAGAKLTYFGKFLGGLGAALSAADIVMTWTMSNETSQQIGSLIQNKEKLLAVQKEELKILQKNPAI